MQRTHRLAILVILSALPLVALVPRAPSATAATPPVVMGILPAAGPASGGVVVTITGSGFTGAYAVLFGGVAASGVVVVGDGVITAIVPPSFAGGPVDVIVVTPAGASAPNPAAQFTYLAVPPNPDLDGDGFAGGDDACPSEPGTLAGCPIGGAFVVGDGARHAAGDSVNFWGAQWQKNNPTSAASSGSASFKGWENSTAAPTCGGTWASRPGNSANPPASVPAGSLMAVVVTDRVAKSGSTISGTVKQIVLVRVSPGYGPNPGHAGIGEVVSVLCSTP